MLNQPALKLQHFFYRIEVDCCSCRDTLNLHSTFCKKAVFDVVALLLGFTFLVKMPAVNLYGLERLLGERIVNQEINVREGTLST